MTDFSQASSFLKLIVQGDVIAPSSRNVEHLNKKKIQTRRRMHVDIN